MRLLTRTGEAETSTDMETLSELLLLSIRVEALKKKNERLLATIEKNERKIVELKALAYELEGDIEYINQIGI